MSIRSIAEQLGLAKSAVGRYCEGMTVEKETTKKMPASSDKKMAKGFKPGRQFVTFQGACIGKKYILLGSDSDYVYSAGGISTRECIDFLTRDLEGNPIRTVYGLAFHVNHWVRDIPKARLRELFNGWPIVHGDYTLEYLAGHIFYVGLHGRRYTFTESRGYFEGTLDSARRSYLGNSDSEIGTVEPTPTEDQEPEQRLRAINRAECLAHSKLMEHIRAAVTFEGDGVIPPIKPAYWHGPGAVASTVLKASGVGDLRKEYDLTPPEVRDAFQYAYFGGRSEQLRLGAVPNVHAYDLHSAYPWAMSSLPIYSHRWRKTQNFWGRPSESFAIWHVDWDVEPDGRPGPLPWRTKNGYILYPARGAGWYWQAEIVAAIRLFGEGCFTIGDGYVMEDTTYSPLAPIVLALYAKRQELKAAGDRRELGLKLAMNALYGKFCQSKGKSRYYNLAYAGWITAQVRARLLSAVGQAPENVIAFNTDSILTDAPLVLNEGEGLGEWEHSTATQGTFIQPGLYRLSGVGSKARRGGFRLDTFPWDDMLAQCTHRGTASIYVDLFVTHQLARRRVYKPFALQIIRAEEKDQLTRKTIAPFSSIKRDFIFPRVGRYKRRLDEVQYYSTMPNGLAFEEDPFSVAESYRSDVFEPDVDQVFEDGAAAIG